MQFWKILQSRYLVKHPIVSIRQDTCELPNGRVLDDYYVVEENDVAVVFALTEDQQVVMVEQYKHGIQETCMELPGGYLDSRTEDPAEAARRELLEETGYMVGELTLLGAFVNQPTRCNNRTYTYFATEARRVTEQNLDDNENIHIRLVALADLPAYIRSGRINVALSIAGIYMALDKLRV
ncbi:MAG: NUDIX hydrolase [Anaerolineae bacterium]